MKTALFAGLMSGTSADGVDAALLEVTSGSPSATLMAYRESPFTADLQQEVLSVAAGSAGVAAVARLRRDVTLAFARATVDLLSQAGISPEEVTAVGCHGQTVWHVPPGSHGSPSSPDSLPGTSLQLLDPALLAARTGIPVVSDFRSADLAAGGQGAPLVPWPDRVLFSRPGRSRALVNLGGMANVTWLPPVESGTGNQSGAGPSAPGVSPADHAGSEPLAFDTGPGNALMDEAARLASGGKESRDTDGRLAAAGNVDAELLERLLADPFFRTPPPRSTGREHFGAVRVAQLSREAGLVPGSRGWPDLMATLVELTTESVARALKEWVLPRGLDEVVLTGGGARNPVLVARLEARLGDALGGVPVLTGAHALGMDPDAREAAAFALLAWAFHAGVEGNVPACTGASESRVLGSWTPSPTRGGSLPSPARGREDG